VGNWVDFCSSNSIEQQGVRNAMVEGLTNRGCTNW